MDLYEQEIWKRVFDNITLDEMLECKYNLISKIIYAIFVKKCVQRHKQKALLFRIPISEINACDSIPSDCSTTRLALPGLRKLLPVWLGRGDLVRIEDHQHVDDQLIIIWTGTDFIDVYGSKFAEEFPINNMETLDYWAPHIDTKYEFDIVNTEFKTIAIYQFAENEAVYMFIEMEFTNGVKVYAYDVEVGDKKVVGSVVSIDEFREDTSTILVSTGCKKIDRLIASGKINDHNIIASNYDQDDQDDQDNQDD